MRILVVGAGRWGTLLIKKFDALLGAQNVLIAEKNTNAWPWHANVFGTRSVFGDYLQALAQQDPRLVVDAVVVATQPAQHYMIAADALDAGKHVLVEKPLCMDSLHARDLYKRAKERSLTLQTDDTFSYAPGMPHIEIPPGREGTLVMDWWNPKVSAAEDPILWVNGPHPISLMLATFGLPVGIVAERLGNDYALVGFRFDKNRTATFRLVWNTDEKLRRAEWRYVDEQGKWCLRTFQDNPMVQFPKDALQLMCEAFLRRCFLKGFYVNVGMREPFGVEQRESAGEGPWQDERGVQVVEVLEMIEKAAKQ